MSITSTGQRPKRGAFVPVSTDPLIAKLLAQMPPLDLLRFVALPEAARLSGLSQDSIERHHADKIIQLSPRRKGIRVVHCLMKF
jgi:hypothetical protein